MVKEQIYTNRLQFTTDDILFRKIEKLRGDVPVSIFIRKFLEKNLK